jgi:predicted HTH transcriptional regulator
LNTLYSYIREGEHQTQDFKFRIDDARKIARTLVAFANTDGGRLLIGVKDNGKVTGIDPEEEFHMIQGAAEMYCQPPIEFTSQIWQDDHKLVLEIIVPPSPLRPHSAKDDDNRWRIYIRQDDHTLLANKILIALWKLQKKGVDKPQEFTEEENHFLGLFRAHEQLTLSKLYRLSTLKKNRVDYLLTLFIFWAVLEMHIHLEGTFYSLKTHVEE